MLAHDRMGKRKTKSSAEARLSVPIFQALPEEAGAPVLPRRDPPTEFRVFAVGVNACLKEPYEALFDDQAAIAVMDNFAKLERGFLNFDWEHDCAESAGRWVPEIRNGELWATKIQWQEQAYEEVASRKYELFSPFFNYDPETKRVLRILNCALTNLPALENALPLIAASEKDDPMDPKDKEIEELKAALALALKDNEELKASIASMKASSAGDDKEKEEAKAAASLRTSLAAATGKDSPAAMLGVIEGWKGKA